MSLQAFLLVLNPYKSLHFQLHYTINSLASSWLGLMKYSMFGAHDAQTALSILNKRTIALWLQKTLLIPVRLLGTDVE